MSENAEIRYKSLWNQAAYDEAIKWSRTIVAELEKSKLTKQWGLLSTEVDLLTTYLAGEISRKRGAEPQQVLNKAQTLKTIYAGPAAKIAQARMQAQDDVAADFFEKAQNLQVQNRQLNLTTTAQDAMVEVILRQHPSYSKDEARVLAASDNPQIQAALEMAIDKIDVGGDLSRLANMLSATMMGKLEKKFMGDSLPKSNDWAVQVGKNFRFSVTRTGMAE